VRKVLAVVSDLVLGLPLVAVAFLGVRVLLQSQALASLFFPSLCLVSLAIGFWRGRTAALAFWQTVALLNLPLSLMVLWFLSKRSWPLLALPVLASAFSALGAALGRGGQGAKRRRAALLPPVVIVSLVLGLFTSRYAASLIVSEEVSEAAVPFQVSSIDGGEVSAQQLRGRVVVLDFWATWCGPCRRELPEIERLYERFEGRRDVVFYAIDGGQTDTPGAQGDSPEQAREYFRKGGYRIPLARDPEGGLERSLSVSGYPTLLVLDRAGRVRFRHVGFIGSEDLVGKLVALMESLLAEGPA
jgi:thiol-disulfide isomerase/thioredoxin